MITRELKTPPVGFPITLDQVKTYSEVNDTQQDTLIGELIEAATSFAEDKTGRVFINQTWTIFYDIPDFQNVMNLDTLNVNSITSVTLFDRDNTSTLLDSSNYEQQGDQIVFNESFRPSSLSLRNRRTVAIEVIAGYGTDSTNIPKDIQSALAQITSYWKDNNDMDASKDSWNSIPLNSRSKLQKYIKRLHWI